MYLSSPFFLPYPPHPLPIYPPPSPPSLSFCVLPFLPFSFPPLPSSLLHEPVMLLTRTSLQEGDMIPHHSISGAWWDPLSLKHQAFFPPFQTPVWRWHRHVHIVWDEQGTLAALIGACSHICVASFPEAAAASSFYYISFSFQNKCMREILSDSFHAWAKCGFRDLRQLGPGGEGHEAIEP